MFLEAKNYYRQFDPTAAYQYGRIGGPQGLPVQGKWGVGTGGANIVTVTSLAGEPFAPVKVGDIITFKSPRPDGKITRKVATKPSNLVITVDTAVNIPGNDAAWFFSPFTVGTADSNGWHQVNHWSEFDVYVRVNTLTSTSIQVQLQHGSVPYGGPVTISETTIAAVGTSRIPGAVVTPSLRIGIKSTGDVAGDSVDVWVVGRMRQTAGV